MSQLASYIISGVLRSTAMVVVILVAVGSVIEFVAQLDDVGVASYGMREAVLFVALRIPAKVFEVLPAAALLGALLSLGNLAVHRELVVMRASGVSHYRLLAMVGSAGIVLFVVMVLLGESMAPRLGAYAREMRGAALLDNDDVAAGPSTWIRDGDTIVNIGNPDSAAEFEQSILIFELDGDGALERIASAESVGIDGADDWEMRDYAETTFGDEAITAHRESRTRRALSLNQELLDLSEVRADLLDTPTLVGYIGYLERNGLDASRYQAAYWGRISNGVSVVLMTLLALPFVMGGLRSAGTGGRMVVGLVIGLGYYVLVQVSASSGQVFALDPLVAAWAPSALLLLVTAVAVARLR
jgi:lipopolysaccharide export system permease protein